MTLRLLQLAAALLTTATLALGGGAWWVTKQWSQPLDSTKKPVTVEVPSGATLRATARHLDRLGIVKKAWLLEALGRYEGNAGKIQPGEYALSAALSPRQILIKLVDGEVVQHPVTLPEGLTVAEIFQRLAAAGFGTEAEYEALIHNPRLQRQLGVVTHGVRVPFEGYLFPDTYLFTKGSDPQTIVRTLARHMAAAFTPRRQRRMAALGWDRHRTLTMASLIEKETALASERPRVSAVFHNRLKRHMRLQTDPTVIYAIPDFDGDIRTRDLRRDDPYNTSRHHGLPPGPIAAPGEAAIEAALFPSDDPALYFVSRGNGSHSFSNSVSEHNRAVRRYQR